MSGASRADPSGTRGRVPPPCGPCTVELQAQSLEPSRSPRRVPGTVPRWPLWAEGGRLAGRGHSRTSKQVLTPVRVVCGARRCCSGHSAASAALRPPPPALPFPPLAPGRPVRERAAFWSRTPGRPLFHARPLEQSHQRARGKAPGPRPRRLGLWALLCWARLPAGAAPGGRTGECGGHALPCPWPSSVLEAWGAHSPPQPLTCGPRCPTRDRGLGAPCALLTRGPDPPGALTPQALSGCTPGGRGARCLRVWVLPPRERGRAGPGGGQCRSPGSLGRGVSALTQRHQNAASSRLPCRPGSVVVPRAFSVCFLVLGQCWGFDRAALSVLIALGGVGTDARHGFCQPTNAEHLGVRRCLLTRHQCLVVFRVQIVDQLG